MPALPERRTRPTIRCLRDDLGIALPTVDVDLGSVDHPLIEEARRVAPAIPAALGDAAARREQDVAIRVADRVDLRLFVSAAGDEVRVAIATRAADGGSVDEPVRDVLFRIAFDAAEAEVSEPRFDCRPVRSDGSRPLAWVCASRVSDLA